MHSSVFPNVWLCRVGFWRLCEFFPFASLWRRSAIQRGLGIILELKLEEEGSQLEKGKGFPAAALLVHNCIDHDQTTGILGSMLFCPCMLPFTNRRWPFIPTHLCFLCAFFAETLLISLYSPALVVVCLRLLCCVCFCFAALFCSSRKERKRNGKKVRCLQGPSL